MKTILEFINNKNVITTPAKKFAVYMSENINIKRLENGFHILCAHYVLCQTVDDIKEICKLSNADEKNKEVCIRHLKEYGPLVLRFKNKNGNNTITSIIIDHINDDASELITHWEEKLIIDGYIDSENVNFDYWKTQGWD